MTYKLSLKAEEDILNILVQGAQMFGRNQAELYHLDMEGVFNFLAVNPYCARERSEINPPVRIHPYGSHIIIYIIADSNQVLILRVRHSSENWQSDPI
jgi:toxin ParE1/3/4